MAKLIPYINTLFKPYYKYITGIVLLVLFILVSKFVYETYFVKYNKNKELANVANAKNTKQICAVYFFYVDWCPHCVKAKPEWNNFKDQYNNKVINGYVLKCYDIDCTKDNGDEVIQFDNSTGKYGDIDQELYEKDKNGEYKKDESGNKIPLPQQQLANKIPIQPTPIKLSALIQKYNIDSYPTIKLTKGDLVVEFDSKITKDTLVQFVNSV
jgi:thiol-disulfide isomerase/thioredoxin